MSGFFNWLYNNIRTDIRDMLDLPEEIGDPVIDNALSVLNRLAINRKKIYEAQGHILKEVSDRQQAPYVQSEKRLREEFKSILGRYPTEDEIYNSMNKKYR